jgi:hypothetical protein
MFDYWPKNLTGNGKYTVEEMIEMIKNNAIVWTKVRYFCPAFINLDEVELRKLAEAFKTNTTFINLDLEMWADEDLEKETFYQFLAAIVENPNSKISTIKFGEAAKDDVLVVLGEFIQSGNCKNLEGFDASNSWGKVTDIGAIAIGTALSATSLKLKHINLSSNSIGDVGVLHIASALLTNKKNDNITYVNLNRNSLITDGSIDTLKEVIQYRLNNPESAAIRFGISENQGNINKVSSSGIKELHDLEEKLYQSKQLTAQMKY